MPKTVSNRIAHGCPLTVITEPELTATAADDISDRVRELFPELNLGPDEPARYDLLSLPDPVDLAADRNRFDLLVGDVLTAVDLHQAEFVAVLTGSPGAELLAERLAATPELRGVTVRCRPGVRDCRPLRSLALTCMDWRLHGPGGFRRHLVELCGDQAIGVMTVPGAAKEFSIAHPRGFVLLRLIDDLAAQGLRRLIFVSHTDCGKYGGRGAFVGPEAEEACLAADMAQAAALAARRTKIEYRAAVAEIEGNGVSRIRFVP